MKSVSLVFHIEASRGKIISALQMVSLEHQKSQRDAFPKVPSDGVERGQEQQMGPFDTVATLESEEYGFESQFSYLLARDYS